MAKPRVIFVGHSHYELPLSSGLARKWDALAEHFDYVVIASGRGEGDPRFHLVRSRFTRLESVRFFGSLPRRLRREIGVFRPDVLVAQSPYEALAALAAFRKAHPRPRLIVEVHGDWRTAARLYGSAARRLYAPLADRLALTALRAADGTRAIGPHTARLAEAATGVPPLAVFPTYTDIESFVAREAQPLPMTPTVVWVGALERVKDPDALARAWPTVVRAISDARLVVVGTGRRRHVVEKLRVESPGSVEWHASLPPSAVARRLDDATLLVLPSRSEGMGRVVIEAFCRGRPVVASATGGILDMVVSGENGLLVAPGDSDGLARTLIRVLGDRSLAERLAQGALSSAARFQWTPDRYAHAMRGLVERAVETKR